MPSSFDFSWSPYGHVDFSCLSHMLHDFMDDGLGSLCCFWGNVMSCHISLCCPADGFDVGSISGFSFVRSLVDWWLIFQWIVFFALCGLSAFIWVLQRRFRLILMSLRVPYLFDTLVLMASL